MSRELLQQALDALTKCANYLDELPTWSACGHEANTAHAAITALREALAAPMPEPSDIVMVPREPTPDMARAGWALLPSGLKDPWDYGIVKARQIYRAMIAATPPAAPATVVPLTDEQILNIALKHWRYGDVPIAHRTFARTIEKAHGIGGGGK